MKKSKLYESAEGVYPIETDRHKPIPLGYMLLIKKDGDGKVISRKRVYDDGHIVEEEV